MLMIPNKLFKVLHRNITLGTHRAQNLPIPKTIDNINERLKNKVFEYMSIYEETIGLKEIKQAQQTVLDSEKNFLEAQNDRRDLNSRLIETQQKLRDLRDEMDRLTRTDTRYLKLFTEEHSLLQIESKLVEEYKLKESKERDLFFYLSTALRDAQEKERIRVERTKYLQLGLSILCTSLGILSAYLLNYFRNSNIREILMYDMEQFENVKKILNGINQEHERTNTNLINGINTLELKLKSQDLLINKLYEGKQNETINQNDSIVLNVRETTLYPVLLSSLILLGSILFFNK